MTIIAIIILTIGHLVGLFVWQIFIDWADENNVVGEPEISVAWAVGYVVIALSWAASLAVVT